MKIYEYMCTSKCTLYSNVRLFQKLTFLIFKEFTKVTKNTFTHLQQIFNIWKFISKTKIQRYLLTKVFQILHFYLLSHIPGTSCKVDPS